MSINRELSQLASFLDVQEDNNFIGISTAGTYTVGIGTSSVIIGSTGIITATQFHGPSGSSLIDKIDLQDEGSPVGTGFTTLNFVGTGVTITEGVSGIATVTITGSAIIGTSGEVEVIDNGDGTTTLALADEVGITSSLTVGTVKIESGIITATSGIVTYHGDGSGLTNINASSLSGIATDSDKLDGEDGTYYLDYANFTNTPPDVRWFGTAVGIWTSSSVGIGTTNATSTLTVDGTLNVSGISTFTDTVSFGSTVTFGDNDKIILGDGNDLQIYHDPNEPASYISDQGEGQLRILTNKLLVKSTTDNVTSAVFNSGGAVSLHYNNSKKFETVGTGVSISSGTASTATIYGPGNLIIDPAPVDDNGGIVRIKGDLYVDGTTTEINSTTLTVDDLNVVVASGATNGLTADGAGLSVAGAGATIKYNYNGGGANEQWVFNKAPYYNTDRLLTTADEGDGNGIDADTLDGQEGSYYLSYSNFSGIATDSDKLDGQEGSHYLDYNNFTNTPTIPTVNDATLTLATSGDGISGSDTFTANQSTDTTFTVTVASASTNQASTLVYRDASGGFSAGIVTAGIVTATSLNVSGTTTFQGDVSFNSDAELNDNRLHFGTNNEFDIYHVGTTAYLHNSTGDIIILNGDDDRDVSIHADNGSGGTIRYFRADGSSGEVQLSHYGSQKLATKSNGIDVTGHTETDTLNVSGISTLGTVKISSGIVTASSGIVTYYGDGSELTNVDADTLAGFASTQFLRSDAADIKTSGNLTFNDLVRARFGTSDDLHIYHNGTDSYISQEGEGSLLIRNTTNDEDVIIQSDNGSGGETDYFRADGSTGEAILYHYGNQKFATKSNGIDVTGHTETDTLNVSGIATAQDFNSASDENLKTNIRTIEDPLAKVVQIRGVNFDWKESQRPALGVIAQEVEKVLPELVTDNGTKTVNYNGLIGLLIETVKEQQKQIDTLSERLSKLE